jgi:hypothetical protein
MKQSGPSQSPANYSFVEFRNFRMNRPNATLRAAAFSNNYRGFAVFAAFTNEVIDGERPSLR